MSRQPNKTVVLAIEALPVLLQDRLILRVIKGIPLGAKAIGASYDPERMAITVEFDQEVPSDCSFEQLGLG